MQNLPKQMNMPQKILTKQTGNTPPRDNWKKKKDEFERFHLASFAATLLGFALKLPRRKGKTLVTENSVNVHIFESLP